MVGTGRFELPTPRTPSEDFVFAVRFRRLPGFVVVCLNFNDYKGFLQVKLRYVSALFRRVSLRVVVFSGQDSTVFTTVQSPPQNSNVRF